jgi:Spy/CpxP family protein refolding chaperone
MGESGWSGRDRGHRMGRRSGRHGGPDHFLHRAEKLELTEQQIEALKALKWDHEKSTIEMRAQIETAHVDLKQLLDQEKLDFGKIKAKVSQMADLRKKMELARWTLVEKSHDLLTAEQLEKAKTLRRQGSGSMKEGRRQMIKKMIIEEDED